MTAEFYIRLSFFLIQLIDQPWHLIYYNIFTNYQTHKTIRF